MVLLAAASVLMRQTNVVWICMACGVTALDIVTKNYAEFRKIKAQDVKLYDKKVNGKMVLLGRPSRVQSNRLLQQQFGQAEIRQTGS